MIEKESSAGGLDASCAIAFKKGIGNSRFRRPDGAVDRHPAPTGAGAWGYRKTYRGGQGTLGEEPAAIGYYDVHSRSQIDSGTRFNGQGNIRRDGEGRGDVVGTSRCRPGGVGANGSAGGLERAVIIPNIDIGTGEIDAVGAKGLDKNSIKARL